MMFINKLSNYTVIYGLIGILINIHYHVIPPIESIPQFPLICQRTCAEKNKSQVKRVQQFESEAHTQKSYAHHARCLCYVTVGTFTQHGLSCSPRHWV